MKIRRVFLGLASLFLCTGLVAPLLLRAEPDASRLLARVEPDGTVSAGSKEALRQAVEDGKAIRVGWALDFNQDGRADLVHWADATFLTVFGSEVYAQISPIREQGGARKGEKVVLQLAESSRRWHAILGTNGILEGAFDDNSPKESLSVRIWWCLKDAEPKQVNRS